jgi:hypothetical protein
MDKAGKGKIELLSGKKNAPISVDTGAFYFRDRRLHGMPIIAGLPGLSPDKKNPSIFRYWGFLI